MRKRLLLDLYCGEGGCSMGYSRAGFDIVGVDIVNQPNYPFKFIKADALTVSLKGYDAIHSSPPCQAYSIASKIQRDKGKIYPDLLQKTRSILIKSKLPWIIENVPNAPFVPDLILCGCMFGLPHLRRKRLFELSWHPYVTLPKCMHIRGERIISICGRRTPGSYFYKYGTPSIKECKEAMDIDWMSYQGLNQAIPPAYTEFIGKLLMDYLMKGQI